MKKIFNVIFIFFIFVLFSQMANAKLVKVDVIADTHVSLAQNEKGEYKMTPSIRNLKTAVKDINKTDADYVVFLGDNISSASKEGVSMFAKIINSLSKPYYVLIGNHDVAQVSGIDKEKYFKLLNRFSKNRTKKVPSLKVVDNKLVFIFMDGVNQFIPSLKGYFTETELVWLDKKLDKYKNFNVVIFQHFPIVEPVESKAKKTVDVDDYIEVLNKHDNVKAIVSGHYHEENEVMENGIYHISAPALVDNGEYKELNIEYDVFGGDFEIRTKMLEAI